MGTNCSSNTKPKSLKHLFKYEYLIGRGGFSRVWKVSFKTESSSTNRIYYAMKQISKAKIIINKTYSTFIKERNILSMINHPFIIKMKYAFQDTNYLYIIMDYHKGGDLRYHLLNNVQFNEEQTSK